MERMDKEIIGSKLRQLRGNTSRAEVARACNISVSTLQNYEDGFRIPKDDIKIRLADYYKVKVGDLFFC